MVQGSYKGDVAMVQDPYKGGVAIATVGTGFI